MLYSVIRTPRLCDQFHKTMMMKNKENQKLAAKLDVETHLYLRQEISAFPSEQAFVQNFM